MCSAARWGLRLLTNDFAARLQPYQHPDLLHAALQARAVRLLIEVPPQSHVCVQQWHQRVHGCDRSAASRRMLEVLTWRESPALLGSCEAAPRADNVRPYNGRQKVHPLDIQ